MALLCLVSQYLHALLNWLLPTILYVFHGDGFPCCEWRCAPVEEVSDGMWLPLHPIRSLKRVCFSRSSKTWPKFNGYVCLWRKLAMHVIVVASNALNIRVDSLCFWSLSKEWPKCLESAVSIELLIGDDALIEDKILLFDVFVSQARAQYVLCSPSHNLWNLWIVGMTSVQPT